MRVNLLPHIGIRYVAQLAADVELHGGTVPRRITSLLAAFDTISSSAPSGEDPTTALLRKVATGGLTGDDLTAAIADAAAQDATLIFRQGLRLQAEQPVLRAIAQELGNGAADEIIASLRPAFDQAVATLVSARKLVSPSDSAESFLRSTDAAGIAAWNSIDPALARVIGIAGVVIEFGPVGRFEMVRQVDDILFSRGLDQRAVMCVGPDMDPVTATQIFRKHVNALTAHRNSPWFEAANALRLNTIGEAYERVRVVAEGAFDALEAQYVANHSTGDVHPEPRRNPYALAAT